MAESLAEDVFERLADDELRGLLEELDALSDDLEADLQMGVLSITFEDGTKYVVNSHRAARQIWMAAEKRAWHFDYHPDDRSWRTTMAGDELWSTLAMVLGNKLGTPLALEKR